MKKINSLLLVFLILSSSIAVRFPVSAFQKPQLSPPVNLSRSGDASQPSIMVLPDKGYQAFWWDKYDGLMSSSSGDGIEWTEPIAVQIPGRKLSSMPLLIYDGVNKVHAFWIETQSLRTVPEEKVSIVEHSQNIIGQLTWSSPVGIANSVVTFDIISPAPGVMYFVYLRTKHTTQEPAGVYFKKNLSGGTDWSAPVSIINSIYMRSITADQADLGITSAHLSTDSTVEYVTWVEPRQGKSQIAFSSDNGDSWSSPAVLESDNILLSNPQVVPLNQTFVFWQSPSQRGCTLYQQDTKPETSNENETALTFGALEPIMSGLSECPRGGQFFEVDDKWFWMWSRDSTELQISALNMRTRQWSQPYRLDISFIDPITEKNFSLGELNAALDGRRIAMVGVDPANRDVWFVKTHVSAIQLAYAPTSPWGNLIPLALKGYVEEPPEMVVNSEGLVHAVWSQATSNGAVGNSIQYAQSSPNGILGPIEIVPAAQQDGFALHPALFYEARRGLLHLVWSGGENGVLLHKWVREHEAGVQAAWSQPRVISGIPGSSRPQLQADRDGNLYVLFVVPVNEARGVYMVQSSDSGRYWSEPKVILEAAQAGYDMVDFPTLAIGPDNLLHAAWIHAKIPGFGGSIAVEYVQSADQGQTWIEPIVLSGSGFNRPRLAYAGEELHLLFAPEASSFGGIYHRYVAAGELAVNSGAWSVPIAIPGLQQISPKYGLAAGNKLYLLGASAASGALIVSIWDEDRWKAQERFEDPLRVSRGLGVSAATGEQDGQLVVSWLAIPNEKNATTPSLFMLARQIPVVLPTEAGQTTILAPTLEETITPVPNSTVEDPSPLQTALPPSVEPSNTAALLQTSTSTPEPQAAEMLPLPPMAFGGILSAVLVVVALAGSIWFRRISAQIAQLIDRVKRSTRMKP
jgi:hypothetical protein